MSESTKITGTGPFGQCGVPPSHDGTVRGQSPVPGGLIGSAGVEPSGTIFKEYRPATTASTIPTGRLAWCIWLAMGTGGYIASALACIDPMIPTGLSVVAIVVSFVAIERIDGRAFREQHRLD